MFRKIKNLVGSNIHALLNGAEDPKKMMGYAIIKMQKQVEKSRKILVEMIINKKRIEKDIECFAQRLINVNKRIHQGINTSSREAAMELIAQGMEIERLLKMCETQKDKQEEQIQRIRGQIQKLKTRIEFIKGNKNLLLARQSIADIKHIIYKNIGDEEEYFKEAEEKIDFKEIYADVLEEEYKIKEEIHSDQVVAAYERLKGEGE